MLRSAAGTTSSKTTRSVTTGSSSGILRPEEAVFADRGTLERAQAVDIPERMRQAVNWWGTSDAIAVHRHGSS
jgi:hypothetical protein